MKSRIGSQPGEAQYLVPHVGAFQHFMPGIRMQRHGGVRHCQGTVLVEWVARGSDGTDRARGTHVFVLGVDGRIESVVGIANTQPPSGA